MRTLVVDDDATSRFLLQEILAPYGEVHSCVDGIEAVEAFQRSVDQGNPYQLICLDIMMPLASGIQALKKIRQCESGNANSQVRILMITALKDHKTVTTSFREQCDGYLVKPINKADLLNHVRSFGLIA